ncbi:glycoside hydrolase family 2 protein, partial [Eisenbergiella porci]|uniref:glycoside hydrolase family 2 protein n=1 Tax=Eisenbergiella porci TaxID=2652274 RepID=UPI002F40A55B
MELHLVKQERHEFFGFGWTFHYGDLDIHEAEQGEKDFSPVTLPHDWLMDYEANGPDEKSGSMNWKYGVGIYRKEFIIDKSNKNRIISLLFDGVYQDATVYLNGEKLGNNYYGYIPFEFDITNKVNIGEVNTLLVRVDNSAQPNTRWYSGSGITRDVWISSLPPIHVASNGTYIVTDSLENNIASLSITTEISNSAAADSEIEIKNKIYSPDGLLIASMSEKMTIGAGLNNALIKQNLSIRNALLWSPEHPYMHQMITEIIVDSIIEDQYVTPFGIRTLYFDADKGL